MQHFDIIIVGGGVAGLSLAVHLAESSLRDRTILIIDKNTQPKNDRILSFWAKKPTLFDEVVSRSWDQLNILSENLDKTVDLQDYRYHMIRGIDFYNFARQKLAACPHLKYVQNTVTYIDDGPDQATVYADGEIFTATWVFDSRFTLKNLYEDSPKPRLKLYFTGWEIETPEPVFDPHTATLMDFRTAQNQDTRFFYVLPTSEHSALVEYSLFTTQPVSAHECEAKLRHYIAHTRHIKNYRIVYQESGIIPTTKRPLPRQVGRRVMTIGTLGGRVKPSTGYAFWRIQQDSANLVASLEQKGHPFAVLPDPPLHKFCDALLLQVMTRHGDFLKPIFTALFKHNSIQRVFRFLDEETTLGENLRLIISLPPRIFLQTLFEWKVLPHPEARPAKPAVTRPA